MDLQELLLHFRRQVDDEAPQYLWDDPEALLYAIDAQDQFVRLTGGISDTTVAAGDPGLTAPASALQDLAVTTGSPYTAISPYVLRVRSARLLTLKVDLRIINESDMGVIPVRDYGWTRGLTLDDTDVGDVRFLALGIRDNQARWVRVPNADDTCRMHVYRLPLPRITSEGSSLVIGEEHHIHLVQWMKHLAYSKQDGEVFDPKKAQDNEAMFVQYCERSRKEIERRRYKPRAVQFSCPGY